MTYGHWFFALSMFTTFSCTTVGQKAAVEPKVNSTPKLTTPKYRTIWVPDKIEGDRYEEGHRVHIIEEAGRWISQ